MYDTETTLAITTLVRNLTDEQMDLLLDVVASEKRKRSVEAKELKDDEMRSEAQVDGEQYEKELKEANNQI